MNAAELRAARRELDSERVASALAACLEEWRGPDSHWVEHLCAGQKLFSPANLRRGLALGLVGWNHGAIIDWLHRERPPEAAAPELTATIVAGSIPTNAFALVAAPLLAGSAVFAHVPSEDPYTLPLLHESLAAVAPDVGRALQVGDARSVLAECDAIVAEGRDTTLQSIRAQLPSSVLFVGYGHKLSLAAIGADADPEDAARRVALDIALYDGRGCLSPAYVLIEERDHGHAQRFCELLSRELEELERAIPRGSVSDAEHMLLRELRTRWVLSGVQQLLPAARGTDWAVALQASGALAPAPGILRNVPVVPITSGQHLEQWVAQLAPELSTLAHAGWRTPENALASMALRAGGSRVCALGHMQRPPLGWRHDGRGAIEVLLRYLDVESSSSELV